MYLYIIFWNDLSRFLLITLYIFFAISIIIESIKIKIDEAEKIIKYKSSSSYKNKILKEQQSFKNIWENVIFLTTEKIYDKFTKEDIPEEEKINDNKQNNSENKWTDNFWKMEKSDL